MPNYTTDVPQASQPMNQTYQAIQDNFTEISAGFAINHVAFNTSTTFGMHNLALMPFLSSDPTALVNDINVYTKATGSPNIGEIFMQYPSGLVVQLSGGSTSGTTTPTTGTYSGGGWIRFPSGMIIKYGTFIATSSALYYFPVGTGIPVFKSNPLYCKISPMVNSQVTWVQSSAVVFTTYIFAGANPSTSVNYFCIGF